MCALNKTRRCKILNVMYGKVSLSYTCAGILLFPLLSDRCTLLLHWLAPCPNFCFVLFSFLCSAGKLLGWPTWSRRRPVITLGYFVSTPVIISCSLPSARDTFLPSCSINFAQRVTLPRVNLFCCLIISPSLEPRTHISIGRLPCHLPSAPHRYDPPTPFRRPLTANLYSMLFRLPRSPTRLFTLVPHMISDVHDLLPAPMYPDPLCTNATSLSPLPLFSYAATPNLRNLRARQPPTFR